MDTSGIAAFELLVDTLRRSAEALVRNGGPLLAMGDTLFWALLLLMLTWVGVTHALAQSAAVRVGVALLQLTLTAGIAWALVHGIGHLHFLTALRETFEQVGTTLGNLQGDAARSSTDVLLKGLYVTLGMAQLVWDTAIVSAPASSWNIAATGAALAGLLLAGALKIAVIVVLLLLGLVFTAQVVVSQVLIYVAVALAPLLVPFLLLPATAFIFAGWLRFTLTAGLVQVVGLAIMGLLVGLMNASTVHLEALVRAGQGNLEFALTTYATLLLAAALMAALMLQVPTIANGLVGGSVSTGFSPGMFAPIAAGSAPVAAVVQAVQAQAGGVRSYMARPAPTAPPPARPAHGGAA